MTEVGHGFNDGSILGIQDISLNFGGLGVLSSISFYVPRGTIYAIIGPNGAGKTSIFNCICGLYRPWKGSILFENRNLLGLRSHEIANLGIARTFQNIELFKGMTVLDNIMVGRHSHRSAGFFWGGVRWGKGKKEEVASRKFIEEEIIDLLEIEHLRKEIVGNLPYGLQKRVELGRALAIEPKLLLLDEPMAGMNVEETEDMARFILDVRDKYGESITMLLIEHDMGVVMDLANIVFVMNFGVKVAEGKPQEIQENPLVINAYLGTKKHG